MHAYKTYEIILYEIMISYPDFKYDITLWYTGIWHHILKSYAWDMISQNQNIWFQVTYDIIVSSMKSYPWNHGQAYDVMQSCLWNHSNAYDIIDLWYHKTMISKIHGYDIICVMISESYPWNMKSEYDVIYDIIVLWYHRYDIIKLWYHNLWYHR